MFKGPVGSGDKANQRLEGFMGVVVDHVANSAVGVHILLRGCLFQFVFGEPVLFKRDRKRPYLFDFLKVFP